jgi:hypothetical protein
MNSSTLAVSREPLRVRHLRASSLAFVSLAGIALASGLFAIEPSPLETVDPALVAAFEADSHALHPIAGTPAAVRSANLKNKMEFTISPDQLSVRPMDSTKNWRLGVRLEAIGRGEALVSAGPGALTRTQNRAEITRNGGEVVEWFVHRKEGLEQGFTLNQRPAGEATGVTVSLSVEGGLRALASQPGDDAIRLADASGQTRVRYAKLVAWDATGRSLSSRMEGLGDRIHLTVDDAGATYPVTIDPVYLTEEAHLLNDFPTAATNDLFAHGVCLAGDTAVIGCFSDNDAANGAGSVYVYKRTLGVWTLSQKLMPADLASGNQFGHSIALCRSTQNRLAVGSPGQNAVYLFTRPDVNSLFNTTPEAKLVQAGAEFFGYSVAVCGPTVVVGAPGDDLAGNQDQGSVHFYQDIVGTWTLTEEFYGMTAGDHFGGKTGGGLYETGLMVAVQGNWAVGSAPLGTIGGLAKGYVRVFNRPGAVGTPWAEVLPPIQAADGVAGDNFGFSIALDSQAVLVGAPDAQVAGVGTGAAYYFTWNGTNYTQTSKFNATGDSANGDRFGVSVGLSNRFAVVGAPNHDGVGNDAGAAYLFFRGSSGWTLNREFTGSDATGQDHFGSSCFMNSGTLIFGAPQDDILGGRNNAGSAYIFAADFDIGILTDNEFAAFFDYTINQQGRMTFHAVTKTNPSLAVSPLPVTADEVICTDGYAALPAVLSGDKTYLTRLLYEGDPIPGTALPSGGTVSRTFPEFRLQESGMSYFLGRANGSNYATDYFELADNGSTVGTWVREGAQFSMIYPGLARSGAPADPILGLTSTESAHFAATLALANGITLANDSGIWRATGDPLSGGPLEANAREGVSLAASVGTNIKMGQVTPYVVAAENGTIAYSAFLIPTSYTLKPLPVTSANNLAVFKQTSAPGSPPVMLARRGMGNAPGGTSPFYMFTGQAINPEGRVALKASMRPYVGNVTPLNDEGLWAEDATGALQLILLEGMSVDGAELHRIVRYWMLADGSVVAQCLLRGSGVTINSDQAILLCTEGQITVVSREGTAMPGVQGSSPLYIQGFDVSPNGKFTMLASLVVGSGNTTWSNNAVLLRGQLPDPSMDVVLRSGDTLRLRGINRVIHGFTMSPGGVQRIMGGGGGHGRIVNDAGDIGIIIKFRGTFFQGIFVWPEIGF